jgi:hypothetical protein
MIKGDSVAIPITQKVYRDSLYTAYVSGYMQSLDSIMVRERTINTTVTLRERQRRWNVGIVGGYGMGLGSGRLEPFVGVGVTFNLFVR